MMWIGAYVSVTVTGIMGVSILVTESRAATHLFGWQKLLSHVILVGMGFGLILASIVGFIVFRKWNTIELEAARRADPVEMSGRS